MPERLHDRQPPGRSSVGHQRPMIRTTLMIAIFSGRVKESAPTNAPPTIRVQPTRGFSRVLAPRELWRYRELGLRIAIRDITVRYRQTVLGALWAILQPVASMVVFSLLFGRLAHLPSEGHSYALFTLVALVPWTFFAN